MANTAILKRNGTSVTIDLLGEGGDLTVARDVGKPTLDVRNIGGQEPRHQDNQNAQDTWTITGFLIGSSAYDDAQKLAEQIIVPRLSSALTLDLSSLPDRSTYSVVPAGQSACTLTYVPGTVDVVGVQLSLATVRELQGGSQDAASFGSVASGDGVKLTRSDDGTSVTLTSDVQLTRTVGRPGIQLQSTPFTLPIAIDQNDPASDVWELSGSLTDTANATSTAKTLEESLIRPRLGQSTITLEFLSNQWSLGKYQTIPSGTQSLRTAQSAGAKAVVDVPTIELRTVRA